MSGSTPDDAKRTSSTTPAGVDPGGVSRTVARRAGATCSSVVARPIALRAQVADQSLGSGVVDDVYRHVDVAGEPRLGPDRHGQTTDERPRQAAAIEFLAGAPQGIQEEGRLGRVGHDERDGPSPSLAAGRSRSHSASNSSSRSGASPGWVRRSVSRRRRTPASNRSSTMRNRSAARLPASTTPVYRRATVDGNRTERVATAQARAADAEPTAGGTVSGPRKAARAARATGTPMPKAWTTSDSPSHTRSKGAMRPPPAADSGTTM
jgi:hypothetical protein